MWAAVRYLLKFGRNQDGAFAVIFALISVVLIAVGGAGVDFVIWMEARNAAQEAADAAVLGASASSAETEAELNAVASALIDPRMSRWAGVSLEGVRYDDSTKQVTASVRGTVRTYFVHLVGVQDLPVFATSTAERATNGELELALVLDNTWSMSDGDGSGGTKIQSLKAAAHNLLDAIWEEDSENIRVGLVPYAEYVNVGTANRNQPWMSVAADTVTTTTNPRVCQTKTTRQTCTKGAPKTCTRVVDGVSETYDCTPSTCTTYDVPPYESCSGGNTTTTRISWFGCVLSRIPRNLRLSDLEPQTAYIGFMGTSKKCMTEILPLTDSETDVRNAINAMVVNVGSYRPLTYIPTGVVWGINLLSHSEPFTGGLDYDPANAEPRKALILMTDGDNTLRFNSGNGQHATLSTNVTTGATQKAATDADTISLCSYAKSHQIEVFTVSFGVLTTASDTMLQNCATDIDHYYSATNAAELNEAFENIANQLKVVRLVH